MNPHDRNWPREFKSLVSTDSTIWATAQCAAYDEPANSSVRQRYRKKRLEIELLCFWSLDFVSYRFGVVVALLFLVVG